MINEYALDPNAICQWSVFRHVALGLGFAEGRVFARFPKEWVKQAYNRAIQLDQNDRKKVETWLADVVPKAMVNSRKGRPFSPEQSWLENALEEHKNKNFRAIVSNCAESENPPILNVADIDASKTLWSVARQIVIQRRPDDFKPVDTLLVHANEIRIVDPYFMADPDQMRVLLACVKCFEGMPTTFVRVFQLHVDGEKVQPKTVSFLQGKLDQNWPTGLPKVSIIRWKPDYLHNRFILADCGGLMLGDTMREHPSRPDQLTLLENVVHRKWWEYHDTTKQQAFLAP